MKTVVSIGCHCKLVVPAKTAGTLVNLLSEGIAVSRDFDTPYDNKEYFVDGPVEVTLERIPENKFRRKPVHGDVDDAPQLRLGPGLLKL